jgi:hypothetical protein
MKAKQISEYYGMKVNEIIFIDEKQVINFMTENRIAKIRMYVTAYVNNMNYQDWGFTIKNVNSDYYLRQKAIHKKTQTFNLN